MNRVSQASQDLLALRASRVSEATLESRVPMGHEGHQETLGSQAERSGVTSFLELGFIQNVAVTMCFVQKTVNIIQ